VAINSLVPSPGGGHTARVTGPTPDAFAALARSSPWRWSTLRLTARWPRGGAGNEPVRAWLRRPDRLRVETTDGVLLKVVREDRRSGVVLGPDGGRAAVLPWPGDAGAPAPDLRADGLVARRPDGVGYDDPYVENYFWIALLDPVELADGRDPETGEALPGATVESVTEVDHFGRTAWEAVVRTTRAYGPRCSCCPLLPSRESDLLEYGPGGVRDRYPDGYRVRLDLGTGVCVLTEALDGGPRGSGHEVRIEAVDEPMPDGLFLP
jgi:hypothetical protein